MVRTEMGGLAQNILDRMQNAAGLQAMDVPWRICLHLLGKP